MLRFDLPPAGAGGPGADSAPAAPLPELAAVRWRRRAGADSLRTWGRTWTVWTIAIATPFVAAGIALLFFEPLTFPVAVASFAHAWVIPELYAARGTNVVKPRSPAGAEGEPAAQGLLGDLLDHGPRELQRETGLALERGRLGVWLVGEAGALLVAPGGRRIHCFCVTAKDKALPPSDRIAHLLLALRTDEQGFATVANHAFAGAGWRIRRRLRPGQRPALATAVAAAREPR
jgi:hypothetical protein